MWQYVRKNMQQYATTNSLAKKLSSYKLGENGLNSFEDITGELNKATSDMGYNIYTGFDTEERLYVSGLWTEYGYSMIRGDSIENPQRNEILQEPNYITGSGLGQASESDFFNIVTGTEFIPGNSGEEYIETENVTGKFDFSDSFIVGGDRLVLENQTFTGLVPDAEGPMTGLYPLTINAGSGTYAINEAVTGAPNYVTYPIMETGEAISDFSGAIPNFVGTGFYEDDILVSLVGTGFHTIIPTYQRTFTGEYNFYTGESSSNLIQIPYDQSVLAYQSGITVTRNDSFALRVEKLKYFPNDIQEINLISYSGGVENTGGIVI